jgi:hypothetical protein
MRIILFVLLVLTIRGYGQAVPDNIRAANTFDVINQDLLTDHMIYTIPLKPGNVVGSVYLEDEWKRTILQVYVTDKILGPYSCKVNLHTGQIEVMDDDVLKIIDSRKIKNFTIEGDDGKKHFVNGHDYIFSQAPLDGFLEVLVEGEIPLFQRTSLTIMRPDNKPELNVGNKNARIIKKESFLFAKGKELTDPKGLKGNVEKIFGEKASDIKKFIRDNSLKLSRKEDLIQISQFYNSL